MNRTLEAPKVKDILIKKAITLRPSEGYFDAIEIFNKHHISAAPVVNEHNEVIGNLTEGDCIKYLSQTLFYDESRNITVDLIMSKKVIIAEREWDIFELEAFFLLNNLRSAPVVDSDKKIIGIVARKEVLLALEQIVQGRQKYKTEIKAPVICDFREKVRIILRSYQHLFQ